MQNVCTFDFIYISLLLLSAANDAFYTRKVVSFEDQTTEERAEAEGKYKTIFKILCDLHRRDSRRERKYIAVIIT